MADGAAPATHAYRWFAAAAASWFLGWSIQSVVFTWLVIGDVRAAGGILGTVQTALTLPGPLLAMLGGALADRVDRRRLLIAGHAGMAMLSLALAATTGWGSPSLTALLAYAVCAGSLQGLALPTRAVLLGDLAGAKILRAVTLLTVVQSSAQVVGPLAAASTATLGASRVLTLQGLLFIAGAFALLATPAVRAPARASVRVGPGTSWSGFADTLRSPVLRPLMLAAAAHALGYIGPLYVLLPLLVRDVYAGGIEQLGLVAALFPAGIVLGSVVSMRFRRVMRDRRRAMITGLAATGGVIAALSLRPPAILFAVAVFAWGGAASVFFNMNRTLIQESAEMHLRARAVALQTVGPMLAGPASSMLAGALCALAGPTGACLLFGVITIATAIALWPRGAA
jgi:MFS family permease